MEVSTRLLVRLAVAAGIGALIGMERERSESAGLFAGSRTFPLISLLGALTEAFFSHLYLPVTVILFGIVVVAYAGKIVLENDLGLTTPVVSVLTFFFGAMTTRSDETFVLAVVLGTLTTVLLAAKGPLHALADRISTEELRATLKFLIVVLVVYPLLPNRGLPWLLGLNPRFVWLMVILVSGLSFTAYVFTRWLGPRHGIGATGVLGGFVSSTATAVSMAERTRSEAGLYRICGFAIVVASVTMFPRMLVEVLIVHPELALPLVPPVVVITLVGAGLSGALLWRSYEDFRPDVTLKNPFRLQPALLFGGFFGFILLVSEWTTEWFGAEGLYGTALLSGLADVNAITLSLAKLARDGSVDILTASGAILTAGVANTAVKVGIAWFVGGRRLGRLVGLLMLVAILAGLGSLYLEAEFPVMMRLVDPFVEASG